MIRENIKNILSQLPEDVKLVVAAKDRSITEVEQIYQTGIETIGENYIQQAKIKFSALGDKFKCHLIGHLQKNKIKVAVKIFDMVETLDSLELARILNRECEKINKVMPVLIEINSASEVQKNGVIIDDVEELLESIVNFNNLKPMGLMTMGPFADDVELIRPYFRKVKVLFDKLKTKYNERLEWIYLSMGMSSSYKIAIEEGANVVRVGTAIFGPRSFKK